MCSHIFVLDEPVYVYDSLYFDIVSIYEYAQLKKCLRYTKMMMHGRSINSFVCHFIFFNVIAERKRETLCLKLLRPKNDVLEHMVTSAASVYIKNGTFCFR